ncbi:hypothetical protein [Shewanella surugensis]|uniref:Lipoprotein n=1 Tax=Shewanella surugensis TaxID=212020 RepID=A0ABT0LC11_9GAMM|nr:hypothetical protein [Shewanella surugensis]MCL1125109.1 hypothetical protein [Shewanella surugensis]
MLSFTFNKNIFKLFFLLPIIAILAACSTQPPITLEHEFWEGGKSLGIHIQSPKQANFRPEGAIGLLDWAIISAATSELSNHIETLDDEGFIDISNELKQKISENKHSITLTSLDTDAITAKTIQKFKGKKKGEDFYFPADLTPLKAELNVDHLLLFKILRLGVNRSYHGFIPLSEPNATMIVAGTLVDLTTNKMLWYGQLKEVTPNEKAWDEGPEFAELTKNYQTTINRMKTALIQDLTAQINSKPLDTDEKVTEAIEEPTDIKTAQDALPVLQPAEHAEQ